MINIGTNHRLVDLVGCPRLTLGVDHQGMVDVTHHDDLFIATQASTVQHAAKHQLRYTLHRVQWNTSPVSLLIHNAITLYATRTTMALILNTVNSQHDMWTYIQMFC